MALTNMMEQFVAEIFNDFQNSYNLKCNCDRCKEDIIALTLNRIPAKYVSSHIGEVHVKTRFMDSQMHMDIMKEMARSTIIVENNPHYHAEKPAESLTR